MKRKILFFITLLALVGLATIQSCKKDEPVQLTEYASFTDPVVLAPSDGSLISVSGTTVELTWESTNADGFPPKWDVYFGESSDPELYASGHATNSITVPVAVATEYFWRVEIADENGIETEGHTWSFEVIDPAAHIGMDLTWESNAIDVIGMEIDPLEVANLRLRILKSDLTAAVTAINTTGFESFNNFHTLADGKYFIAVDLTATVDAGDFNAPISLDLQLDFSQRGIQEESYSFPEVMTNQFVCAAYRVYLGYVTKTGSNYEFTKEITKPVSVYSGVWLGVDSADVAYPSEVETYQGCSLQIKGLVNGWMSEFWGETIVKGGSASITIDATTGVVTIPDQYYCTTKYNGAVQTPYNIVGTGTYDATGEYPTMTIQYTVKQGTDDWAQWMFDEGYQDLNKFIAILTLDPDGLPEGTVKSLSIPMPKKLINKPRR
jgi:hypothetical protein